MSKKTVAFKKKLGQALRKGHSIGVATDLLTPSATVLGTGTKRYKTADGKAAGGGGVGTTVTKPRRKPTPKGKG